MQYLYTKRDFNKTCMQEKLGEIVFCELPDVGTTFEKGESFAVIESVKAAEDLFIPVSGEIAEINEILSDESQTINTSPFDKGIFFPYLYAVLIRMYRIYILSQNFWYFYTGWLVKVNLGDGFDSSELLNADEYNALKDSEE